MSSRCQPLLLHAQELQQGPVILPDVAPHAGRHDVLNSMLAATNDRCHVVHRDLTHRLQAVGAATIESVKCDLPIGCLEWTNPSAAHPSLSASIDSPSNFGMVGVVPSGPLQQRFSVRVIVPDVESLDAVGVSCAPCPTARRLSLSVRRAVSILLSKQTLSVGEVMGALRSPCSLALGIAPIGIAGATLRTISAGLRAKVEHVQRLRLAALCAALLIAGRATLIMHRGTSIPRAKPPAVISSAEALCWLTESGYHSCARLAVWTRLDQPLNYTRPQMSEAA